MANQSQEPTAADVAAARPKDLVDPFTKPSQKPGGGNPTVAVNASGTPKADHTPKATHTKAVTPPPGPPPTPPTPPTVVAVGIFASKHGPEAILADKDPKAGGGGNMIVTTGTRLADGGYVKSIDPVSRKVVIDKENTDFVLPLEAPSGPSPSTPGK
jgi:hypothetical protein